jgi:D-alanyl-D-alanine carboxypeptidase
MSKLMLKIGCLCFLASIVAAVPDPVRADTANALDQKDRDQIDQAVHEVLDKTGAPGASLAVVKDGHTVYLQAYGNARLEPPESSQTDMRYSIGSVSKQFTATALLMLAEQGKLSLDDPVAKFLPDLTRAGEVKIRQLLSHTSGYQDYWPQDYVPPSMLEPVSADEILDGWARKPLDFDPGTKWQYSNTNFVIAGVIVEKASGMKFMPFLRVHIFEPLGMKSVLDIDQNRLTETDASGYRRYALGPLRVAPKEGKGWLFAAGQLAMTAEDLARWDIAMIESRLLTASSYKAMQTDVLLRDGVATRYGLGLQVTSRDGRRVLEHGGEVSGFTSENIVFPDDRAAIAVLVNQDASNASSEIADKIAPLLFPGSDVAGHEAKALGVFEDLQKGRIDRSLLTENANFYFNEQALQDYSVSLAPLGKVEALTQTRQRTRGGMTYRGYKVKFPERTLEIWSFEMPDGKIEQFQVHTKD